MATLPGIKFVFLGIRQLTRPLARQIVSHATTKHGITYSLCIGLGRVSLGLSGVIAEWSRNEELKKMERQKRSEEAEKKKKAAATAATPTEGKSEALEYADDLKPTATATASPTPPAAESSAPSPSTASTAPTGTATASTAAAPPEKEHVVTFPSLVTPRSRSLLEPIMFGPNPQKEEPYDTSIFLDPAKRTPGAVMRVFITHPYQSTWYVFKTAFLSPFPEKRLVDAGADFLIELIAYTVLATLLFIELRQASRLATAKEERVNARLDAIEEKINELVRTSSGAVGSNVEQLPPVPELHVKGRLDSLNYLAKATYKVATDHVLDPLAHLAGLDTTAGGASGAKKPRMAPPTESERAAVASTGAAAAPVYDKRSFIPKAPPPDPQAKVSKHDESNAMKAELARALGQGGKAS